MRTASPVASRALRWSWLLLCGASALLLTATVGPTLEGLQTPCLEARCADGTARLSQEGLAHLQDLGVSARGYALYTLAVGTLALAVFWAISGLLFWRSSGTPIILLLALAFLASGAASLLPDGIDYGRLALPVQAVGYLSSVLLVLVFYRFPDGRWVPTWTRWAALAFAVSEFVYHFQPPLPSPLQAVAGSVDLVLYPASLLLIAAAQLYRYRRHSDAVKRQQTKWVVLGLGLTVSGWLSVLLVGMARPELRGSLPGLLVFGWTTLLSLLIPLSLAAAVLRYRLFDLDLIIRRTLLYGLLTGTLVGAYLLGVVALQGVFRPLLGEASQLAVVVSTLAVAGLFAPLRRRLQRAIDRIFYRDRPDPAKVLAAFGRAASSEVELEALAGAVLTTVELTMRPRHVSLWLRAGTAAAKERS